MAIFLLFLLEANERDGEREMEIEFGAERRMSGTRPHTLVYVGNNDERTKCSIVGKTVHC